MITLDQWHLIARCEASLYRGENGAHAFTSVWHADDPFAQAMLSELWSHTYPQAESSLEDQVEGHVGYAHIENETARRIAAALAVMAFGKEFLLK